MINGAAGGVGHFALQIAKLKGAHVIAVASAVHEALLRELGANDPKTWTKAFGVHIITIKKKEAV